MTCQCTQISIEWGINKPEKFSGLEMGEVKDNGM
jgi:hypothetical protein